LHELPQVHDVERGSFLVSGFEHASPLGKLRSSDQAPKRARTKAARLAGRRSLCAVLTIGSSCRAREAARLDARVAAAWGGHPHRVFVESTDDFLDKMARVIGLIREEVPPCCRWHPVPEIAGHGPLEPVQPRLQPAT
jgi:hypothetical protein